MYFLKERRKQMNDITPHTHWILQYDICSTEKNAYTHQKIISFRFRLSNAFADDLKNAHLLSENDLTQVN